MTVALAVERKRKHYGNFTCNSFAIWRKRQSFLKSFYPGFDFRDGVGSEIDWRIPRTVEQIIFHTLFAHACLNGPIEPISSLQSYLDAAIFDTLMLIRLGADNSLNKLVDILFQALELEPCKCSCSVGFSHLNLRTIQFIADNKGEEFVPWNHLPQRFHYLRPEHPLKLAAGALKENEKLETKWQVLGPPAIIGEIK